MNAILKSYLNINLIKIIGQYNMISESNVKFNVKKILSDILILGEYKKEYNGEYKDIFKLIDLVLNQIQID
jgi:hypothetical protein